MQRSPFCARARHAPCPAPPPYNHARLGCRSSVRTGERLPPCDPAPASPLLSSYLAPVDRVLQPDHPLRHVRVLKDDEAEAAGAAGGALVGDEGLCVKGRGAGVDVRVSVTLSALHPPPAQGRLPTSATGPPPATAPSLSPRSPPRNWRNSYAAAHRPSASLGRRQRFCPV